MKTILVPTDFSHVAENAINYAAEIAKVAGAQIILFHAFHIPVVTNDVPVMLPDINDLEKNCLEGLERIERRLYLQHGKKLTVKCVCKCGFAVDEIDSYALNHKVDLIVMGMQGAGYLAEKLVGSVTTALINRSKCPVLAIDKEVKYRSIKKIVLACDYLDPQDKEQLDPLKAFVKLFSSHVYVLNVIQELEPSPAGSGAIAGAQKMEPLLENVEHTFHHIQSDEVVDGINEFVIERKMDMVAMIPRKHSLFSKIFNEPNTKKMAFHSKVPLLALH